jgi:hypothetical protein
MEYYVLLEFYVAFKIPYVYSYITELCRTQVEVILYDRNATVHDTGQDAAMHRKYKRLNLCGGQAYDHSDD